MRRYLVLTAAVAAVFCGSAWADEAPSTLFVSPTVDRILRVGATTTQGDAATNAPQARSTYGVSGSNIKIGIISDSFNALGGYPTGFASGDLPTVNIVKDDAGSDEGRAMAEIVHDVAPGAQILFHSAFNNNTSTAKGVSIANAINALVAAGANVIVDDVGYANQPIYQLDRAAQAVQAARAAGTSASAAASTEALPFQRASCTSRLRTCRLAYTM
jgi:hypothetical protein